MIAQAVNKKPRLQEQTGAQTIQYTWGGGILARSLTQLGTYTQYRALRKEPTVALGRGIWVAGILNGAWSVEADEDVKDEVYDFITNVMMPLRTDIIRDAIAFGRIDFGWMGFEKIFAMVDDKIVLDRVKPLLHDFTNILVDEHGNFGGYRQQSVQQGLFVVYPNVAQAAVPGGYPVDLPIEKCLHIAFDIEAGNLYGVPLLENIRAAQTMWDTCNDGAKRYDAKLAGEHWVVYYPKGSGTLDGESVDNSVIARRLLAALESSGNIALPVTVADVLPELDASSAELYKWKVELLAASTPRQASFVDRLKYLDALKLRGMLIPERAAVEGRYGTKAEAGVHTEMAIAALQEADREITRLVNVQCVDQLLALNFGEKMQGKVRLVCTPLVDLQVEYLRDLYKLIFGTASATELAQIDTETLKERLGVPVVTAAVDTQGVNNAT